MMFPYPHKTAPVTMCILFMILSSCILVSILTNSTILIEQPLLSSMNLTLICDPLSMSFPSLALLISANIITASDTPTRNKHLTNNLKSSAVLFLLLMSLVPVVPSPILLIISWSALGAFLYALILYYSSLYLNMELFQMIMSYVGKVLLVIAIYLSLSQMCQDMFHGEPFSHLTSIQMMIIMFTIAFKMISPYITKQLMIILFKQAIKVLFLILCSPLLLVVVNIFNMLMSYPLSDMTNLTEHMLTNMLSCASCFKGTPSADPSEYVEMNILPATVPTTNNSDYLPMNGNTSEETNLDLVQPMINVAQLPSSTMTPSSSDGPPQESHNMTHHAESEPSTSDHMLNTMHFNTSTLLGDISTGHPVTPPDSALSWNSTVITPLNSPIAQPESNSSNSAKATLDTESFMVAAALPAADFSNLHPISGVSNISSESLVVSTSSLSISDSDFICYSPQNLSPDMSLDDEQTLVKKRLDSPDQSDMSDSNTTLPWTLSLDSSLNTPLDPDLVMAWKNLHESTQSDTSSDNSSVVISTPDLTSISSMMSSLDPNETFVKQHMNTHAQMNSGVTMNLSTHSFTSSVAPSQATLNNPTMNTHASLAALQANCMGSATGSVHTYNVELSDHTMLGAVPTKKTPTSSWYYVPSDSVVYVSYHGINALCVATKWPMHIILLINTEASMSLGESAVLSSTTNPASLFLPVPHSKIYIIDTMPKSLYMPKSSCPQVSIISVFTPMPNNSFALTISDTMSYYYGPQPLMTHTHPIPNSHANEYVNTHRWKTRL